MTSMPGVSRPQADTAVHMFRLRMSVPRKAPS
jgi:hypothetical protein